MLLTVDTTNRITERMALRAMFAARKEVFIDLLRWDIPALDGRFEIDQFDDEHARYLVVLDRDGGHLASTRLLPTTRPHILGDLFAYLCEGPLPCGPSVLEITRFCLSRGLRAPARRRARDQLVTALARFARDNGITTYTGVAEKGWLDQIMTFGWECQPLGPPAMVDGAPLAALRIDIAADTLDRLAATGIYAEPDAAFGLDRAA